ncbi:MAG: hypothetical protein Ct9H300mP31_12500 [Acidimicrobiaceae bacterium]|nr:MAG: hypothetical protein Ct9H300mP31_12500 [Acidimicrobiaceae bacterium]
MVWFTVALDMVGFGIMLPVLPLYAEEFGASPAVAAAVLAVFSAAQMVAAPLWGRLSDRVGRKPVLVAALVGSSLGSLVTGLAGALWVLFLGRVLDGASWVVVRRGPGRGGRPGRARGPASTSGPAGPAAFGVGFVAGPLIGSIAALGSRELPFFVAAALAAGNALVALVRLPAGPRGSDRRSGARTGGLASWGLAGPAVRRLAGLAMVAMVGFAGFEATFALLVERRFPEVGDPTIYGLFASIGLMMVFVQARIVGPANARLGTRPTLRTSLALVAAGMVVLWGPGEAGSAWRWPWCCWSRARGCSGRRCPTPRWRRCPSRVEERLSDCSRERGRQDESWDRCWLACSSIGWEWKPRTW